VRKRFIVPVYYREEGEEHTRAVQGGGGEVALVYVEAHLDKEVKQGFQGENTY
jgi:hypothetical protein